MPNARDSGTTTNPPTMRTRVAFYAMHHGTEEEAIIWACEVYPAFRDAIAEAGGLPIPVSDFRDMPPGKEPEVS